MQYGVEHHLVVARWTHPVVGYKRHLNSGLRHVTGQRCSVRNDMLEFFGVARMAAPIERDDNSAALFGRVFPRLECQRLRRRLPVHMPSAIGWGVIADRIEVMAQSPLET